MIILIADDEKEIVTLFKERALAKGHTVDVAYDGRRALELISSDTYDLVFLDHNMPELTGLELLKHIKQRRLKAKVVIITGYAEVDENFMRTMGADEYFSKPIAVRSIDDVLDKYAAGSLPPVNF